MIVYVAGPMTGYEDLNWPAFKAAEARLAEAGYTVVSPTSKGRPDDPALADKSYEWFLRQDLKVLLEADAVALLPGAQNSNGARLERHVAEKLGMEVRELEEWL